MLFFSLRKIFFSLINSFFFSIWTAKTSLRLVLTTIQISKKKELIAEKKKFLSEKNCACELCHFSAMLFQLLRRFIPYLIVYVSLFYISFVHITLFFSLNSLIFCSPPLLFRRRILIGSEWFLSITTIF